MAEYGLLSTGLRLPESPTAIRRSITDRLRGSWGASFDFSDESPDGQAFAVVAASIYEVWLALESVYASRTREGATDAALDAVLLLTGTLRAEATYSTVTLTLTGIDGTVVTAGSRVKTASTAAPFVLRDDATIVALTARANSTAYVVGDRRTHGGNAYECITSGTSASSGGPTTTAADITDGTAHWRYLGAGAGAVDAFALAVSTGAVTAVAGDLSVIDTAIGGWSSVTNLLDADVGRDVATDAEARAQGDADLYRPGATTPDAIRETLLALDGVETVTVFYNATDATDADGIPPHSIECMVVGGDDDAIRALILSGCAAAGIATYGGVTGTATDSEGTAHTVRFSRPTTIPYYLEFGVLADPALFDTVNGPAAIKLACVEAANALPTGYDLFPSMLARPAFGTVGILEVFGVYLGTTFPAGISAVQPVTKRQRPTWDTSRVTVNVTLWSP